MDFDEFKHLFVKALDLAVHNAEEDLGKAISRNFQISFYGLGHNGDTVDVDQASHLLFIDGNNFYRIVDIAVQQISSKDTVIFVRISGHPPVPFNQTWDTPKGTGPFKQIKAQIREVG